MRVCPCGLDHEQPLPDTFERPPVVYWVHDRKDVATCHVCWAEAPVQEALAHLDGCAYAATLEVAEGAGDDTPVPFASPTEET